MILAAAAILVQLSSPGAAVAPVISAPAVCASHDAIVAHLARKHGEQQRFIGLAMDGSVVELYVSDQGTWSVLLTAPHGLTCLIGAGEGGEFPPSKAKGPRT